MGVSAPPLEVPGWHGKLPSLGDFASRRLNPDFIDAWDRWLSEGLEFLKRTHPSEWLQDYLDSPGWQFVLGEGAMSGPSGSNAWMGVMIPSVDRVGRHFPFTIALPLPLPLPTIAEQDDDARVRADWLRRIEDIAVDALNSDWSIECLEAALLESHWALNALTLSVAVQRFGGADGGIGALEGVAVWHAQAEGREPQYIRSIGLPRGEQFASLFRR